MGMNEPLDLDAIDGLLGPVASVLVQMRNELAAARATIAAARKLLDTPLVMFNGETPVLFVASADLHAALAGDPRLPEKSAHQIEHEGYGTWPCKLGERCPIVAGDPR